LVVRDYDEALAFFTVALRFSVVEDTPLDGGDKRWGGAAGWMRGGPAPGQDGHTRTVGARRQPNRRPRLPLPPHQRLLG